MLEKLKQYCAKLELQFDQIDEQRKLQLLKLSTYFSLKIKQNEVPRIIAICTHNSRRSHITQLWLAIAATYYNYEIKTFSGGTEATEFHPNAIIALQNVGIYILKHDERRNPTYNIQWTKDMQPYQAFSKHYATNPNPTSNFGAILVCNNANEACPIVQGADVRLAIPYEDPKQYDHTDSAIAQYQNCIAIIGREMLFIMSQIRTL